VAEKLLDKHACCELSLFASSPAVTVAFGLFSRPSQVNRIEG